MRVKLIVMIIMISLTGCNAMPGLQNPNTSAMPAKQTATVSKLKPTLIKITPELVANTHLSNYNYHIAPADILNIAVWQHPELTPKELYANQTAGLPSIQGGAGKEGYLVNNKGYIYFPLVGNMHVAGKTIEQVRTNLVSQLKKYIKHPELNVRVADFRSQKIYVFGELIKPGVLPITDQPLSVTDAISLAHGLDPNSSDPAHIYIFRGNSFVANVYWLNARTPDGLLLGERFILKPNDILYVSSAPSARWNRVLNQLLPTIQTIWYTKAIIDTN